MRKLMTIFEFTRTERVGAFWLCTLCTAAWAVPEVAQFFRPKTTTDFAQIRAEVATLRANLATAEQGKTAAADPAAAFDFDPNTATFDELIRLGLPERTAQTLCNYRAHGGHFKEPDDFRKVYGLRETDFERLRSHIQIQRAERQAFASEKPGSKSPAQAQLFAFDPNEASEEDFRRLGLSEKCARSILNYRKAGGQFRQKSDFKKIYLLGEADFQRLVPYLKLPESIEKQAVAPAGQPPATSKPPVAPASFDINLATVEDWKKLPGIGQSRAERIVGFREKLGGFASVAQVAESRGLPDSVFEAVRPALIFAAPVARKLDLNAATADDFAGHPYFDRRQASLILAYRAQHGAFKSVDELGKIGAFQDKGWLAKVRAYIKV